MNKYTLRGQNKMTIDAWKGALEVSVEKRDFSVKCGTGRQPFG